MQLFVRVVRRLSKLGRWGSYLMEWVRDVVDYVLTYAICFISIYGMTFSEGERTLVTFSRQNVVEIVLLMGFQR